MGKAEMIILKWSTAKITDEGSSEPNQWHLYVLIKDPSEITLSKHKMLSFLQRLYKVLILIEVLIYKVYTSEIKI